MSAPPGDEHWDSRFYLPGLDGPVQVLATDGTNLYAGGAFKFAGPLRLNGVARWDGTNWWCLGNGFDGSFSIAAMAVDGSNVYVGGYFTSVSGVLATNIAQWNGSHWSSLGTGANDLVAAIAVKGTGVYAGGYFDVIDGVSARRVAKWDGTRWAPLGAGLEGYCRGLKFIGDDLYANVVTNILKWDGQGWLALGGGGPRPELVFVIEAVGQDLIVGGHFRLADGTKVTTIGRWDGSSWTIAPGLSATPPYEPSIAAIAVWGSDIYVKGCFDRRANSFDPALNGMARWNGSAWCPVGKGTGSDPHGGALAVVGNWLYAAGVSLPRYIARWNGAEWADLFGQPKGRGVKGSVRAIATSGRNAYVGGAFSGAGTVDATNLLRWDGTNWSAFGNANSWVTHIVATSNLVYIAGYFSEVDGVAAPWVAKWDGTAWSALGNPPYGPYVALAAQGEKVYVANSASGVPFGPYIYEWNGTNWGVLGGGLWGAWQPEVSAPVQAFALSGTDVYIGGMFNEVGGVRATNLARWDGTNWWPVGGGVQFRKPGVGTVAVVLALAMRGHELFVVGNFNHVGGSSVPNANNIAKWDGTNWFTFDGGVGGPVTSLALSGDELYVGGRFRTAGGQPAHGIARWDGRSWSGLGSGLSDGTDSLVEALAISGSDLFVGGRFSFAGGKPASGFSIWHVPQLLQFSRVAGQLNISWPTQAVDFALETASRLPAANWSTVPQPPQVVNGRYTVTIGSQGASGFFRLHRPY